MENSTPAPDRLHAPPPLEDGLARSIVTPALVIDLGAARAMAFLDDLAARFEAEYQAKTTASWQLGHFNSVISQRAKFFSGAPTVRQQKPQP